MTLTSDFGLIPAQKEADVKTKLIDHDALTFFLVLLLAWVLFWILNEVLAEGC